MATRRHQLVSAMAKYHQENDLDEPSYATLTWAICEDSRVRELYTSLYHPKKSPKSLGRAGQLLVTDVQKKLNGESIRGKDGSSYSSVRADELEFVFD